MPTKQQYLESLTATLCAHLSADAYAVAPAHPKNGNLPLDIAYVRVEPWLYGPNVVTPSGSWDLCVEAALHWERAPVLALPDADDWLFRVPLYMMSAEYGDSLSENQWHDFGQTALVGAEAFGAILKYYQEEREAREDYLGALKVVLRGWSDGRS